MSPLKPETKKRTRIGSDLRRTSISKRLSFLFPGCERRGAEEIPGARVDEGGELAPVALQGQPAHVGLAAAHVGELHADLGVTTGVERAKLRQRLRLGARRIALLD